VLFFGSVQYDGGFPFLLVHTYTFIIRQTIDTPPPASFSICLHVAFLLLVSSSVFFSLDCVAVHVFFILSKYMFLYSAKEKGSNWSLGTAYHRMNVAPLGGAFFGHQLHICSVFFCYFSLISSCFSANEIITLTDIYLSFSVILKREGRFREQNCSISSCCPYTSHFFK
jgi:hypothetical protein